MGTYEGAKLRWPALLVSVALLLLTALPACAEDSPEDATPTGQAPAAVTRPELAPLPTLFPSRTPMAAPETGVPAPTFTPIPTNTPIDFDQEVVFLRYEIPLLGLDRTLSGNVSSAITLDDAATGEEVQLQNQTGVMLDLQTVLDELELAPLPAECPGCVRFTYRLDLAGAEGEGWLQEPRLLASVENYFAANLGPHFPAGTVAGLRRSASNTDAAHTVAVDGQGTVWRWSAIDSEVVEPVTGVALNVTQELATLTFSEPAAPLSVACPGHPFETLYLNPEDALQPQWMSIRCPEMTLPTSLLGLYGALDEAVSPILSGDVLPAGVRQPLELEDFIYLGRGLDTGTAGEVRINGQGAVLAARGAISETGVLTRTTVVSLTRQMTETGRLLPINNDIVQRVLVTDTATLDANLLLVRTDAGVFYAGWQESPPAALADVVEQLLAFLERLTATVTPTPEPAGTAESTPPPATSPTPTVTSPPTTTLSP